MKRSAGVTVIAILSLIGSAFALAMGIVILAVMVLAPAPRTEQFPGPPIFFKLVLLLASLMYVLPAVWGILSGVGLWRLKNWARISIIVFSILLILMSAFTGLVSLIVPIPSTASDAADASVMIGIRMAMGSFWLTLLGIGIWWLVFFNRPRVKAQFVQLAPAFAGESTPQMAYPPQGMPVATEARAANRPLSITILAWWLLAGCLFFPLNLLMRGPAVLFTRILIGWPAVLVFGTFAVLQLGIGVGLLRLRPAARMAAILYFSCVFVNSAVFYFAPGGHARMVALMESQHSMFPWMQLFQEQAELQFLPTAMIVIGAVAGLVMITVTLYFLITRKVAYEKAAANLESGRLRA